MSHFKSSNFFRYEKWTSRFLQRTREYLVLLHFAFLLSTNNAFFTNWRLMRNPASSKSTGAIFPAALAHFMSLCHILVILAIFQTFSLLLYLLWWSVIFDVTIITVWRHHELSPYKMSKLINKCYVSSDCSTDQPIPHLSPSPQASLFPKTQQYWN